MRPTPASVRNRAALLRADPRLERRLRPEPVQPRARPLPDGTLAYALGPHPVRFAEADADLERLLAGLHAARPLVLLGVAEGHLVDRLLQATELALVVWERDLSVLQWVLERRDWSEAIAAGRLRLLLASDLVDAPLPSGFQLRVHPCCDPRYRPDASLVERDRPLACVVEGALFVHDSAEALQRHGYRTYIWDTEAGLTPEHEATLAKRPELVAAINLKPGLASLVEAAGLPCVMWEIDPSTDGVPERETPADRTWVFTYRRAHVEPYRRAGYPRTTWLPLAANTDRRRPPIGRREPADADAVCFVGASLVDNARACRRRFDEQLARFLGSTPAAIAEVGDALLALQRRHLDGFGLPAWVDEAVPGFRAHATRHPEGEDPALLLAEVAASERRLSTLAALSPVAERHGASVQVWGDAGWKHLEGLGVRYRGWAGHFGELDRIYGGGGVHIDIGRLYQTDIVTMRVFDVLACGGFLLAEHSDDLAELFDLGVELESWSSPAELADKVAFFLAHPDARRRIARRGHDRVRRDHTIRGRWARMLAAVHAQAPARGPVQGGAPVESA